MDKLLPDRTIEAVADCEHGFVEGCSLDDGLVNLFEKFIEEVVAADICAGDEFEVCLLWVFKDAEGIGIIADEVDKLFTLLVDSILPICDQELISENRDEESDDQEEKEEIKEHTDDDSCD